MTPAQIQRMNGRDEQDVKVRESLIMMRLLEQGVAWKQARDTARELAKNHRA